MVFQKLQRHLLSFDDILNLTPLNRFLFFRQEKKKQSIKRLFLFLLFSSFNWTFWICKVTSAVYNLGNIIIPFRMAIRSSRVCMISLAISIPCSFINNELDNTITIMVSPFITTFICLVFYITNDGMDDSSVFLIKVYIIPNLSIRSCASDNISTIYNSKSL